MPLGVRVFALLVFLLVGCARPSTGAAPPVPSPASPPRLTIATWNIEWLDRFEGQGEVPRSAKDYARLAEYARQLDADVVALQEIDGEQAARRVFDSASYDFYFTSDAGTLQRSGFAWRKTLRATPRPDLTALATSGLRRGADLEIELDGGRMRLLSIHLKSGCSDRSLRSEEPSCSALAAQVPILESWIDARAREGVAYAVLGDFNRRLDAQDELWSAIDDGDPPEADLVNAGSGRVSACNNGRFPRFIDHIVLGGAAKSWLAPGSFQQIVYTSEDIRERVKLSDHCPILVTLGAAPVARGPSEAPRSPAVLRADQAQEHVGEEATVCGVVASARHVDSANGGPTFLNLDRPYPQQPFTVFIRPADRGRFGRPERAYKGKRICVTGPIERYDGKPQIVARDPSQIALGPP